MNFEMASGKRTPSGSTELVDGKGDGSANLKRGRSELAEDAWRELQLSGPCQFDFSSRKGGETFAEFGGSSLWPSAVDDGQRMLSFSSFQSPTSVGVVGGGSSRNISFSVSRNEKIGGGFGMSESTYGPFAMAKWPFTPSQWIELEHQALIYKYIVSNVPIPSNLLIPLKSSLPSYGSPRSYASNFLGWGPFHLGYSRNNDPEPGRCRRTDGKKWRCSKEAVPDQRYCERHINRGRHRSRKPVEGHTGHAVTGSTASKVVPIASTISASVLSSNSTPNSLCAMQHQNIPFQPIAVSASANVCDRSQGFQGPSFTHPTTDLKSRDVNQSIQRQPSTLVEPTDSEFGFSLLDSLPNTSQRIPYMDGSNSGSFLQLYANEANCCNPVSHFIDDWQKDQSVHASGSWPGDLKSDWTQLSMSIPVARDFSSSLDSPAQDKSSMSSLKLSHDFDEPIQKQLSWLPVTWANSVSGPLGEVLTCTGTIGESYSSLKAWKNGPQMGSSPTGVLQKSTFISLSNSSYGSGALGDENKKVTENSSPCNEFPGLTPASSAPIPSDHR